MQTILQSSSAKRALSLLGLGFALATSGCISGAACDTSDDGNPPITYKGGFTTGDGLYYSSPWNENWLHFPGGQRYDLFHNLGFQPQEVGILLSFSEHGLGNDGQGSSAAPSAGNSSVVQLVDGEKIRIKNDTCSDFWVRVTAWGRAAE